MQCLFAILWAQDADLRFFCSSDKLDGLAQAMGDFSFQLAPCGEFHCPPSGMHPTKRPAQFRYGLWKR